MSNDWVMLKVNENWTDANMPEDGRWFMIFDSYVKSNNISIVNWPNVYGWRYIDEEKETAIDNVLSERGKRYGSFVGHANVTQALKYVIIEALTTRDKYLSPDQQEALDMICHKIGRIINGDADYDDNWIDIAGYAKLVADRLQSEKS